jgi:hypothetical protein
MTLTNSWIIWIIAEIIIISGNAIKLANPVLLANLLTHWRIP